ncbi:MAG: EscU/YscU/HrcU family type III secretion system export apparatus switch protein [Spirochaetales bacterium]|nr:EscU/YscU/HrcU family type III secretion system export apparatus switch protein [Spirochaetales bacterium]
MEEAVAVKYTEELPAPFIIAKGKGRIAEIIRKIAAEHHIQIVCRPELADALIEIDIGDFIPEEYYRIIAEILIFVRNLQGY